MEEAWDIPDNTVIYNNQMILGPKVAVTRLYPVHRIIKADNETFPCICFTDPFGSHDNLVCSQVCNFVSERRVATAAMMSSKAARVT